jgi:hypothetical protein
MTGIAPLITIAQKSQVAAAINAGFFNRNNQLPLGAIRRENRWLSGPFLIEVRSPGMMQVCSKLLG